MGWTQNMALVHVNYKVARVVGQSILDFDNFVVQLVFYLQGHLLLIF